MRNKIHILIADDDKYFRIALKNLLDEDAIFTEAASEDEAVNLIEHNYFDIALIDMDIDGPKSGIKILKHTLAKKIHSIVVSSQSNIEVIEEAYTNGCDHFLTKMHYKTNLRPYIHKYKLELFGEGTDKFFKSKYITKDKQLKQQIDEVCKINLQNKSVLITGETGVGKSLIGKLLHEQTHEKSKPFIHINCAEIPENLLESELFGHKKGSFTGAISDKTGRLELANTGTLFLDEVGTMPISMQKKLLKALDEKSFYPVGSMNEVKSEFTLITATCEDLFEKIHKEEFRKDLFYRIGGINLHIKPLRERTNDIPLLINYFMDQSPRKFIIKPAAIEKLSQFEWPGNIRELKKYLDYLSDKSKGIIFEEDIQTNGLNRIKSLESDSNSWLTDSQSEYIASRGLRNFIKKIEEEILQSTLEKHHGKITHAIKELQISSSAFYRIFDNVKTMN